ncbi:hypothetical protein PYCCODRAFT_21588 [Trametes coccinea BRFM310]|uniref:Uncharacterized protein n=1 Tax=Trametes coccinea (strain BRFM310) TaxID=1353009 RepID=A0A1Y2J4W0_TRAC3|nr:hypothetical protein PYCCODRAFT_21588 [Trametes coccinea BRFM310]
MRTLSGSSPPAPTSRRSSMSATMSMSSGHPVEPVHGTAIMPYQAYSAASAAPYPPRPGSPRSPTRGEPPPFYRHPPPTAGRSPTIAYRAPPMPGTPARAGASLHLPPPASPPTRRSPVRAPSPSIAGAGSGSLRLPAPASSSASPSVRRSSISLAEITTPYNREPKPQPPPGGSKNHRAQATPPPGRRLRQCTPPGPASVPASPRRHIHIVDLRQQVPV